MGKNNYSLKYLCAFTAAMFFYSFTNLLSQIYWQQTDSPTHLDLFSFYNTGDKTYLIGDKIYMLEGKIFKPLEKQPPIKISRAFVLSPENIWAANVTESSESDLYYFNGIAWRRINHPLVNNITGIKFYDEKNGYITGYGEIVEIKSGSYKNIRCPVLNTIEEIFITPDKHMLIRSRGGEVFLLKDGQWLRQLTSEHVSDIAEDDSGKIFALASNNIYKYETGKWVLHSSSNILESLNKLFVKNEDDMWAVGSGGRILVYKNSIWKYDVKIKNQFFNDIIFLKNGTGFVAGNNGSLFIYTNEVETPIQKKIVFTPVHLYNGSKTIDDEYGVSINDFNGDGLLDIYAVGIFEPDRLYINHGDRFRDESQDRNISSSARASDIANTLFNLGVASGDVDRNGGIDIFISSLNGFNKFFVNDGNGYFKDFSNESGLTGFEHERTSSALFADFDNDGDLDLFVTNENATNRLYQNNGAGYFKDISLEAGIKTNGGSSNAIAADYDNDGDTDIFVSNWANKNFLFRNELNNGELKFTEVAEKAGCAGFDYTKSNGAAFADFDNDGDLDLFVANRKHSNRLFENTGSGKFIDITETHIGFDTLKTYGVIVSDLNHDGYADLYLNNVGINKLYYGTGNCYFEADEQTAGVDIDGYGTGSSAADMDNDGDIDIYNANYFGASSQLLKNNLDNNNFIKIAFNGTITNNYGIGAKVWLYKKTLDGVKKLAGYQQNNTFVGYASQGPPIVHFGADYNFKYDIVVCFPVSGIKKYVDNIKPGSTITINELEGSKLLWGSIKNMYLIFAADKKMQVEFFKTCLLLLLFILWLFYSKKWEIGFVFSGIRIVIVLLAYFIPVLFFYNESKFVFEILPIVFVVLTTSSFLYYDERQKGKIEKQKIRNKIARDLHDDLASNLSAVSLYVGSLKEIVGKNNISKNELIANLERLITETQESLTEIVWSIIPQYDYLDTLVEKMRLYAINILSHAKMNLKFEINDAFEHLQISHELRRNAFLIYKEIFSNIIKHSSAKNVQVSFEYNGTEFVFTVYDDGIGFDNKLTSDNIAELSKSGQGLQNMKYRAKDIGAEISINSVKAEGTKISVICKMM